MCGHWVSRVEDPQLRNTDTGLLRVPISMSIPANAANLKDCVNAWHSQAHVHALLDAPPLILLQLGMFRHRSQTHVTKLRTMLEIDGAISMPRFVDGLLTQHVRYRVEIPLRQVTTALS